MFVAVNTIEASPEALAHMQSAFKALAPELRRFEGFVGFEVWSSADRLLAISKWRSKEAFEAYPNSAMFRSHHGGRSGEEMRGAAQVAFYDGEAIA